MAGIEKLSSHIEHNIHSTDNIHHAVTDGLIKQEPNIVISSYGSIIGTERVEGSFTITVTDGYGLETIEVEDPVNIKIEMIEPKTETIEASGVKTTKMEKSVNIETALVHDYKEGTVKLEDAICTKTEQTETKDIGMWQNDLKNSETDRIAPWAEMDDDVIVIKTEERPSVYPTVADQDVRGAKILTKKAHTCNVCGKSYTQKTNLTRHEVLHSEKKPFSCTVCGKSFTRKSRFAEHSLLHTGEKPYSCEVCGKSYTQKDSLRKHSVLHTEGKPYSCQVCGKSFTWTSHLAQHNLLHTGEKPFSCAVCGKSFNHGSHLARHRRIHTGEKPYSCTVCGKSFNNKSHLGRHSQMHTGEKSYPCKLCRKEFTRKRYLVEHKLLHTG